METTSETKWMAEGNCASRQPSMFFPSDGVGVEHAKQICEDCPVSARCLEYAIENRIDHGVWGGTSERQRRRIIRSRAESARAEAAEAEGRRKGDNTHEGDNTDRIPA